MLGSEASRIESIGDPACSNHSLNLQPPGFESSQPPKPALENPPFTLPERRVLIWFSLIWFQISLRFHVKCVRSWLGVPYCRQDHGIEPKIIPKTSQKSILESKGYLLIAGQCFEETSLRSLRVQNDSLLERLGAVVSGMASCLQ